MCRFRREMGDLTLNFLNFCVVVFLLLICGCSKPNSPDMPPFQDFFQASAHVPLRLSAQKTFSTDDGFARNTSMSDSGASLLAPTDADRLVGTFHRASTQAGVKNGLSATTLIVEVRATSNNPVGVHIPNVTLPITLSYSCGQARTACPREGSTLRTRVPVTLEAKHQLSANPWSDDSNRYVRVNVSGAELALLTGLTHWRLEPPQQGGWAETDVFIAFPSDQIEKHRVQIVSLRATLIDGAFATAPLSQRQRWRHLLSQLKPSGITLITACVALLLTCFVAMRLSRTAPEVDDAPKLFGALVCIWGWVIAFAPLVLYLMGFSGSGAWYYLITGAMFGVSGLYAYFARPAAIYWYAFGFGVTAIWSLLEYDLTSKQFIFQIGMPFIVGIYIAWLARVGRFDNVD